MNRRNALELVVIGSAAPAAAQQPHTHPPEPAKSAAPRFFNKARFDLVDRLSEMILPADAHSPGASEAKVAAYIDDLAANAAPQTQSAWTQGLDAVEAEARARFGAAFLTLPPARQDAIMRTMAEGEMEPKTALHRFFVLLKAQTLSGYYTSPVGLLKDLQYKGNAALSAFPPCNHPDHHRPEGAK